MNKVKNSCFFSLICLIVLGIFSSAQAESEFQDMPYFSGMPSYDIWSADDTEFDEHKFCDGKKPFTVEGKLWKREYGLKNEGKEASGLQIIRNYSNAIKTMGGTILIEGTREAIEAVCPGGEGYARQVNGRVAKGGKELWIEVGYHEYNGTYVITVLEKEAMKQDVTASDMFDALNLDGHIALYINFDTGKSAIKPESRPIINQIVEMLKSNSDLKISVEGHTDDAGNPKSNKTLSDDRAKAVVTEIVAQGIDSKRLSAAGYGQDKPIADNKTEEGRAKNRRVELVKK
ncbi:MAG: OmpA family protein [Thermodesulfovibrionales bacterium]|nr:OmpA family protein [Thermodesulfovibrionales bacterium]